jgi:hypothetical protein
VSTVKREIGHGLLRVADHYTQIATAQIAHFASS